MAVQASEFINQSILARDLAVSVPEALELLAQRGYWDHAGRRPTENALRDGLAQVIEHPLTGKVTLWSRRVIEMLAPGPSAHAQAPAAENLGAAARPSGTANPRHDPPDAVAPTTPPQRPGTDHAIQIFVASSIEEFGTERPQIAGILHAVDRQYVVYLAEYDPDGDSQEAINRHLVASDYFIAIIGRKLGQKTALEIDIAKRLFREHGTPRVKFFIQKFADNHTQRSAEVQELARELFEEGVHYPREFADQQELIDQVELFFRRLKK